MTAMQGVLGLASRHDHRDTLFALSIIAILTVLFLPMPAWALDLGLSVSLAFAVLILMVALWIEKPLDFSSFPTILLVATVLRLALNIASTRLILSNGHTGSDAAGGVIYGFSQFMIGGNFVIGLIIFAILVVINFVVITKGATRIAEVGARFTLDAIPGKQMAIDADLSAGLIDDATARTRRQELEDESAFFGSMDGASKFVRGDAMAGVLITFINIIGGMIIGAAQMGLPIGQAAATYTILTVGDGLASQIPALVVSLAAGLLVAKGRNKGRTEESVISQLGGYPKALMMVAALMGALALAPGLPVAPFLLLGAGMGFVAWYGPQMERAKQKRAFAEKADQEGVADHQEEKAEDALKIEDLQIEIGAALLSLIGGHAAGRGLAQKVKSLRTRFAAEYGFLLPPVRIKDNVYVAGEDYRIIVQDIEAAAGQVRPNCLMVIDPDGGEVNIAGEEAVEPAFGLPARWIDRAQADEAEGKGYTIIDPESVIITHLAEVIKDSLDQLLTYAVLQRILDNLDIEYHKLLSDLVPGQISMILLQRILQSLLAERVSIRNLPLILEAVSEAAGRTRNLTLMTEHVRMRLGKQICQSLVAEDGFLYVIALSTQWEHQFVESIELRADDRHFAMAPSKVQEFITAARAKIRRATSTELQPALLCSSETRPFVRTLLERVSPGTPIVSHSELHVGVNLKTIDQI
ncbi:MAG: flagellar biosynthesis protein FlhA [Pseudomonadota bacterium]